MKFVVLSVVCLIGVAIAKPSQTKQKRDILPGDPRYGTDYHHHHHEHGSGSEAVQVPHAVYGPPNHTPGTPIHHPEVSAPTVQQFVQPIYQSLPSPTVSVSHFKPTVETLNNVYGAPVGQSVQTSVEPQELHLVHQPEQSQSVAVNNAYLGPAEHSTAAPVLIEQSSNHQELSNGYLIPSVATEQHQIHRPVDSYGAPVFPQEGPSANQEAVVIDAPVRQQQHHQQAKQVVHQQVKSVQQTKQAAPVHSHVHAQSQTHNHQGAQSVKNTQTYAHQVSQPAVHHHATEVLPSVQRQIIYQSEPQTYNSGYFGAGLDSFGSLNSQASNYQGNLGLQTYSSDLSNAGYGFEQDHATNLFQQDFSALHQVHEPQTYHVHVSKQAPQVNHAQEARIPQTFVKQAAQQVHHQPQLPSFAPSHVPQQVQFSGFARSPVPQQIHHHNAESKQVTSHVHQEHTQLIGSNGGYVY